LKHLDAPHVQWTLVFLAVAILVKLKLKLFAMALPILFYWQTTKPQENEEEYSPRGRNGAAREPMGEEQNEDEEGEDIDDHDPNGEAFWMGAGDVAQGGFDMFPMKDSFDDDLGLLGGGIGADMDFLGGFGESKGGGKDKGKSKGKDDRSKGKGKGKGKGDGQREPDPRQVFVVGVGDASEEEIRMLFESCGNVERVKVLTQPDGSSKGVCFVTMQSADHALEALRLTGEDFNGRRLNVRPAVGGGGVGGDRGRGDDDVTGGLFGGMFDGGGKGKRDVFGGGKGRSDGPGGGAPRQPDPKQVFVSGIGDATDDEVMDAFERCGEVLRVKVLTHPTGQPKGVCFVTFSTELGAKSAIELSGSDMNGRKICVSPANGSKDGGKNASKGGSMGGADFFSDSTIFESGKGGGGCSKGDRGRQEPQPRTEIDEILEEALEEEAGPLIPSDFDSRSKKLLTGLMQRDRVSGSRHGVEALEMVFMQTRAKRRDSVFKWPAYIFKLLQNFEAQINKEIESRDGEATHAKPAREKVRGEAPRSAEVEFAWKNVPKDCTSSGEARQVLDRWGKPVLLY